MGKLLGVFVVCLLVTQNGCQTQNITSNPLEEPTFPTEGIDMLTTQAVVPLLGDECLDDSDCQLGASSLLACVNSSCDCTLQAYVKDGECRPNKYLNEYCSVLEDCQHIENAKCQQSVCSCIEGYNASSNNVCQLVPTTQSTQQRQLPPIQSNVIKPNFDQEVGFKLLSLKAEELVLQCNFTAPSTNYTLTWLKDDLPLPKDDRIQLKPAENKLVIVKPKENDGGNYTCAFSITGKSDTTDAKEVIPVVVRQSVWLTPSTTAIEGEKLRLECSIIGKPMPNIIWRFNGNETYEKSGGRVKLLPDDKKIPNAVFQIDETKMEDRGEYHCIALTNQYANSSETVTMVRVKDKLAALWPFLGICAEVFVLCAIILIYEKKRNKTELEESDTDQSPEQKNTPDHGKESVRQRK